MKQREERSVEEETRMAGGVTLLQVGAFLIRNRRFLVVLPATAAVVTLIVTLLLPRQFEASAAFLPQVEGPSPSSLSGLAAQLGVPGTLVGLGESPAFYADLVSSYEILSAVASRRYELTVDGERLEGDLPTILEIETENPLARVRAAVGALQRGLDVRTRSNGIISLSVEVPYGPLAESVASAILDEINRFNIEKRQSRARAERTFVEGRLEAMRAEYRGAEDTLKAFLDRNRQFRNSLQLTFEHDRLERELMLRQQLLVSLNQSYEQSRIDEVKNTPVITVIERPRLPIRPESRYLLLKAGTAAVLAFLLAVLFAAIREHVVTSRAAGRDDYLEFRSALDEARTSRKPKLS